MRNDMCGSCQPCAGPSRALLNAPTVQAVSTCHAPALWAIGPAQSSATCAHSSQVVGRLAACRSTCWRHVPAGGCHFLKELGLHAEASRGDKSNVDIASHISDYEALCSVW
mmetsp:Transcript_91570/g.153413  ORF Transcript_91570/g.153413 Transcript_91570/m.153413 type:complete len:111 (-) Transcript_91570:881-1213(-)